jgi:hypothetical protein
MLIRIKFCGAMAFLVLRCIFCRRKMVLCGSSARLTLDEVKYFG